MICYRCDRIKDNSFLPVRFKAKKLMKAEKVNDDFAKRQETKDWHCPTGMCAVRCALCIVRTPSIVPPQLHAVHCGCCFSRADLRPKRWKRWKSWEN
ncbi:hypothetical protein MOSE0_K03136 [Monosporozyma servazzii]